jgi:AraC family transcriptional activator of tynA and feaB
MHTSTLAPRGAMRHFASEGSSDDAKAQAFHRQMQDMLSVGLTVKGLEARPLAAQMMAYRGDKLRFAALHFSPHSTVSSPVHVAAEARWLVSLHKQGAAVVSQGGRESRVEPGDVFLIDPTRPFHIETGEIVSHSLYVDAAALRQIAPDLDMATARAIRCDSGVGALFRSTMDDVFALAPTLTEDVADDMADALLHLLGPVVRSSIQASERSPSRVAAMHRQRITRFVRENLGDSTLDANRIADAVGLSPRHVYQLFDGHDKSLMRWVWSQRLERCRHELKQPTLRSKSIGEIAFQWGFSNVSHFSRAFKAEYGVAPRDFRVEALFAVAQHSEPLRAD